MDSMYGGKPGISFVLKANYPSVEAMITAFKGGNNYTAVWYGEYVIIDTANKNDKDNGKIYRRGIDYQNSMGGAEYIGQVVGPSAGTPYFEVTTMKDVMENHATQEVDNDISYKRYPIGKDENGCYIVSGSNQPAAQGSPQDGSDISIFDFDTNNCLVPGKLEGKDQWNDTIRYTWVNIRDDTNEADSWFYVGFQIPYTVIDYTTRSISPYNTDGTYRDMITVDRIDLNSLDADMSLPANQAKVGTHPFWEKWRLNVPRGIKGDTLSRFRVTTLAAEQAKKNPVYNVSAISTKWDEQKIQFVTTVNATDLYVDSDHKNLHNPDITTDGFGESTNQGPRQILVLDYTIYDNKSAGETYTIFVGDYNQITGVNVDDDGTVRVQMTHDNEYVYEQRIHWIDYIGLTTGNGSAGGHFTFEWNYYKTDASGKRTAVKDTTEFDICWVKSIAFEQDGSIVYTFAGDPKGPPDVLPKQLDGTDATTIGNGVYRVDDFLRWVTEVDLNAENGHFTVTTNTDRDGDGKNDIIFETDLNWVKFIRLDDDGTIHFIHTIPVADSTGALTNQNPTNVDEKYPNKIKWVNEVSLKNAKETNAGEFRMKFNYGPDYVINLDWVYDIVLDDDGTLHFWHVQNDRDDKYEKKLKWITDVSLASTEKQANSGEFRMKFNNGDPDYVSQLDWIYKISLDEDGTVHFWHMNKDVDEHEAYQYLLKWITSVGLNTTPNQTNSGEFRVSFNNNDPDYVAQLDWIDDVYIDYDSGEIALHHMRSALNTGTAKNGEPAKILDAVLKLIVAAKISKEGVLTFVCNNGDEIVMKNAESTGDTDEPFYIKKVEDIRLKTALEDDKHIQIKYNNKEGDPKDAKYEDDYLLIGDPINYIQDMVVRSEDWHLLVLYTDPKHRVTQNDLDPETMRDKNGHLWANNIEGSDGKRTAPSIYWRDLGTIKDQHGVLIGFNVTEEKMKGAGYTNIEEYLDTLYPKGLTGEDNEENGEALKGKIVTFSKNDSDNKEFYAFDYLTKHWYFLGRLNEKWDARLINSSEHNESDINAMLDTIALDGLLFTTKNVEYSTKAIPQFWSAEYEWSN